MTFEEQFPELWKAEESRRTALFKVSDMYIPPIGIAKNLIEEHCLDKQRVTEAIKTTWYVLLDNQEFYSKEELLTEFVKDLKKELRL